MNLKEFSKYDGLGLAELVKKKQMKPEELVDLSFKAINELNPKLNAVVSTLEEKAMNEIKKGLSKGKFEGVPFLIKELVLGYEGIPTNMGSKLAEGFTFPTDSELMTRFRKAGFVTVGTTTTPEFGYNATTESTFYGPTRNPWNLQHSSGGSSGGSASALSAGIVPVAHANDAGGSIRIPASATGLIGLKPTRGRTPLGPYNYEPLNGLGIELGLTRTVRDTAALLDEVSGEEVGAYGYAEPPKKSYSEAIQAPVRKLKIAWTDEAHSGVFVDPECKEQLYKTIKLLEDLGHTVEKAAPSYNEELFSQATLTIWTSFVHHSAKGVAQLMGRTPSEENLEAANWACYQYGEKLSADDLLNAIDINGQVSREVGAFFSDQQFDIFLTPTMAAPPVEIGVLNANNPNLTAEEWTKQIFTYAPFTGLFNTTGNPAISLPLGMSSKGLPIGMQFVGRFADETTLLQLAKQLEVASPWFNNTPPIHANKLDHKAIEV